MNTLSLTTLKSQVEYTLANYPDTRNSDITLTKKIWQLYYLEKIHYLEGEMCVLLDDLFNLPREDNIKRIRAKIQNDEHKYLPTSESVARKRGWAIDEWRSYLGYTTSVDISNRVEAVKTQELPTKLFDDTSLNNNTNNFRR